MNKKIILSLLVIFCVVFSAQVVLAASLSVSPTSATKNVGTSFSVSVDVDPAGSQVCVVKGTLVFNNLSCQSISVASGLMAQVTPTCANPNFTIGIPKCITAAQNILSVSVKGNTVGQGSVSSTGVKAINVVGNNAVDVVLSQQNGEYTIRAVPVEVQENVEPETTVQTTESVVTEEQPAEEQAPVAENLIPKEAGVASLADTMGNFFKSPVAIIILIVILILIGLWAFDKFYLSKKKQQ